MKDEAMLTTPEAAMRLGVTQSRVRQFILEGRLPSQQFGRDHLIKESDLSLVKTYGKAGRPKKEGAAEDVRAENLSRPRPTKKTPATRTAPANGATGAKAAAKKATKKTTMQVKSVAKKSMKK